MRSDIEFIKPSAAAENVFLEMSHGLNIVLKHSAGRDGLGAGC